MITIVIKKCRVVGLRSSYNFINLTKPGKIKRPFMLIR